MNKSNRYSAECFTSHSSPCVCVWPNVLQTFSFMLSPPSHDCLVLGFKHIPKNRQASQVTNQWYLAYLRRRLRLYFFFPSYHKLIFNWSDSSAWSSAFFSPSETWFVSSSVWRNFLIYLLGIWVFGFLLCMMHLMVTLVWYKRKQWEATFYFLTLPKDLGTASDLFQIDKM